MQTSTVIDASKWRIYKTESGAFRLVPKSGKSNNRCLTIPGTANQNGTNCAQGTYAENDNFRDEWYFARVDYRIDVNVKMDGGYVTRNGSVSAATTRIADNLWKVREKLAEYFYICFNYSSPTTFTSLADDCGNGPTNACSHEQCENIHPYYVPVGPIQPLYHHNNASNIVMDYVNSGEWQEGGYDLLFIGDSLCTAATSNHDHDWIDGISYSNVGVAVISYNFDSDIESYSESATTMHEMLHWFGTDDHYGRGGCPSTEAMNSVTSGKPYNDYCMYGERSGNSTVSKNYEICNGCRNEVNMYLATNF